MRSFKSNENIHKKEGGSYYVVSANKASSVTLQSPGNEGQRKHTAILQILLWAPISFLSNGWLYLHLVLFLYRILSITFMISLQNNIVLVRYSFLKTLLIKNATISTCINIITSLNHDIQTISFNYRSKGHKANRFKANTWVYKCREEIASVLNDFGNRWCKREYVEPNTLKEWKAIIFKIVDQRITFYSQNTYLLPLNPLSDI